MESIIPYKESFNKEYEVLRSQAFFIIPQNETDKLSFIINTYSSFIWEYILKRSEELTEVISYLENLGEAGKNDIEKFKEVVPLKAKLDFVEKFKFDSPYKRNYFREIKTFINKREEVEGLVFDEWSKLNKSIDKILSIYFDCAVFFNKNDGSFCLGIHLEEHYNLLKSTISSCIDYYMVHYGYKLYKIAKPILLNTPDSVSLNSFRDFEFEVNTIIRETKFEYNLKPLLFETLHYHIKDIVEHIKSAQNTGISKIQLSPAEQSFDNSKLNEIINDDLIDKFLEKEKRLKADGFITPSNSWVNGRGKNQQKNLKDLARLILLLDSRFYLKKVFGRRKLKLNDYKKFFQERYSVAIKEQFNEAKKDNKSLEIAKNTFPYF